MNYAIVEIIIYIAWAAVFLTRLRKPSLAATEELLMILFSMPIAIIMEIINEYNYATTGVHYPFSLLYFPGFKFPLAIMFSSSMFTWILYVVSRQLANYLAGEKSQFRLLLQLGLFLALISTNALPEWSGVRLGYWEWPKSFPLSLQMTWQVQVAKYSFYFWMALPPFLVAKFFSWRVRNGAPKQVQ